MATVPCELHLLLTPAEEIREEEVLNLMYVTMGAAEQSHRIPPSPVVHIRGLCDAVVEADLVEALDKFGNIW
ncbi:Heterogeneous nuclear ribonucleoprotein L-like [Collichthys lucidus]|uniref:Heterogeneous nuclear ribonucleoprotein L-like n=1 Tax=Collichthys lucidus TaxID=240159 RepID=A0A4U5U2F2_COLLU|nr:Heterogeneous nuclear ribonucleoprotein L-like [Collichthys lucidus]